MPYEIRFCRPGEVSLLQEFIDTKWKKGHILSRNKTLLDWQHFDPIAQRYNFAVAFSPGMKRFDAILGFISPAHFDPGIKSARDIWLAIWKTDKANAEYKGVGKELLDFLLNKLEPKSVGAIGINNEVKRLYEFMGFRTGILQHYYYLNPSITDYKLAKNVSNIQAAHKNSGALMLREAGFARVNNIDFSASNPRKTARYFENRYVHHPQYSYRYFTAEKNGRALALFIIRKIIANNTACLRIVDIAGDPAKAGDLQSSLAELLNQEKAEYIDCLNAGLNADVFLRMGFNLKRGDSIIPNYFEPFCPENADVMYAHKDNYDSYVIFKGDSDQDRPNL